MTKLHTSRLPTGLGALLLWASTLTSLAQAQNPPGPRREPPPVAFEACQGKKASDACEVALPDRTLTGKCAAFPDGRLVCRPDHPPGPPPGPPPAVFEACNGKNQGDGCSVRIGDTTRDGKCQPGRSGRLLCLP